MNRVVITGLGACTSYGIGVDVFWDKLCANEAVIAQIPSAWNITTTKGYYAPFPKIDYKSLGFVRNEIAQYEEVTLNALLSLEEALNHAKIPFVRLNDKLNKFKLEKYNLDKVGIFCGTGIGGIETFANTADHLRFLQQSCKAGRIDPMCVAKTMPFNVSAAFAIKLGIHSHIHSETYACATGTVLLARALHSIQNGELDMALVCASEYADINFGLLYNSFNAANTLVKHNEDIHKINIPFDHNRTGFLLGGGGSGTLILESLESALKRGAPILAELVASSETFDGLNMVAPDESGEYLKKMLRTLLQRGNITPDQVDYINAHGTGTQKNDSTEIKVFEELFNHNIVVNTTKSLIGHTIAASGALEAIVTVLSLKEQYVHGNNGLEQPISEKINLLKEPQALNLQYAISQSLAFGGHNASLLFKAYK